MTITCYDPELDSFADDLAGDFDYLSTLDREAWIANQWTGIAAAMGWSEALDKTLAGLRRSRMGLADLSTAALGAYAEFVDHQREDEVRIDRARVRHSVLDDLAQTRPRNLWRVDTNPKEIHQGACFNLAKWSTRPMTAGEGAQSQASTRSQVKSDLNIVILQQRAFLADAGPSYFGDAQPVLIKQEGGCGWQGSLRLSLGTFPWVYGHRLQAPAPGLTWKSSANYRPAHRALQIAANLWQPEGNLQQDARDVASQWKHWRAAVAGPLRELDPTATHPGAVRPHGRLLEVIQSSEELHGINGPRGFVSVAAFNFIQRRFAAFFATRRALIRARGKLPPELRKLADQSVDPCLQPRQPNTRPFERA
jgi:hypothetical protein